MTSRRKHRKIKSLYIWHRYVGIIAAVFTIILSITGIALNHTERLQLDASYVESDWLLDWYGIEVPAIKQAYQLDKHWVMLVGDSLYLNQQRIPGSYNSLVGALAFAHFLAVAVDGQIMLLTHEGEVIERLGGLEGVPSGMRRIGGLSDNRIVIQAAHGYYLTNRDFLKWQEQDEVEALVWSEATQAPLALSAQVGQLYRSKELPMERFMLDLHSGRLFGSWGPWLMDGAAILLIFLALTGTWLWGKQALRKRQRRQRKSHHRH